MIGSIFQLNMIFDKWGPNKILVFKLFDKSKKVIMKWSEDRKQYL